MGRTRDVYPQARGDEANDVYVRVDGGAWTKVFASGMPFEQASTRFGTTFDVNHQKSAAQYNLDEGVHTVEIAGRSAGLILDRIHLGQDRGDITQKGLELSARGTDASTAPPAQPVLPPAPVPDTEPAPEPGPDANANPTPDVLPPVTPAPVADDIPAEPALPGPGNETPQADRPGLLEFFVADTDTNETLAALTPGSELDPALLADRSTTIYAVSAGSAGDIGSVTLSYEGVSRTENVTPYALFGDMGGDFQGGTQFDEGDHTISIAVHSARNGGGALLGTEDVSFSVGAASETSAGLPTTNERSAPAADAPLRFYLADAATNETLSALQPGQAIDPSLIAGRATTIYAVASAGGPAIGSVTLSFNGQSQTENVTPYATVR